MEPATAWWTRVNLRSRLAAALIGTSLGAIGIYSIGIWTTYAWLESTTLDRMLGRDLDTQLQSGPNAVMADTHLHYYRPAQSPAAQLPAELARLAPGSYRDFNLPDGSYHVLVRQIAPEDRAYITYDVRDLELRERWLRLALAGGMLVAAALAWLCSRWIADRTLHPLDTLVGRIRALELQGRGARLESRAEDGELDMIVRAFNERLLEIDALLLRERAFASAASHELRTPLAAIRGAAELLASQPGGNSPVLARIERAVVEATRDLDALLALSLARQLPPARPLLLHESLPGLAEPYLAQAQAQGTTIVWSLEPTELLAPPGVINIIFTNLLRNAVRATAGGQIRIELSGRRLSIADSGSGMSPAAVSRTFEPGMRASEGGSGMGLYIVRTLAERCGYHLSLRSAPGAGTRVEILFD